MNRRQKRGDPKTLDDRAYDLLGEMIALRAGKEMLDALEADKLVGDTEDMDAFFAAYDAKNQADIERYFRKQRNKRLIRSTIPKVTRMAASFLGVLFLAGSIAVATSQTFRVRVMELLYTVEEQYTSLKLQENLEASFEVPTEWGGENYPSFLPADIELAGVVNGPASHTVEYLDVDTKAHYIFFKENAENIEMNIDTEGASIHPVLIRGNPGLISTKGGQTTVAWSDSKKFFVLVLYESDEKMALDIANSVIRIN